MKVSDVLTDLHRNLAVPQSLDRRRVIRHEQLPLARLQPGESEKDLVFWRRICHDFLADGQRAVGRALAVLLLVAICYPAVGADVL